MVLVGAMGTGKTTIGPVLSLKRHWPPVPDSIATPEHRALLLAIPDLPMTRQLPPGEA